ncbi:MAG: sodium/proline symporter [Gammaproteobacteria bacterium]|nr:sodium/proline symporter [Gammaproteobacteria bacterium]
MDKTLAILLTLIAYKILLVIIGLWASRRTLDNDDFFLGGRRIGPLVAGISASASSSSAWTLLGVSGAAYALGLPALWLFPATVSGFLINWFLIAPGLMRLSRANGYVTLTDAISGERSNALYPLIVRVASIIILFSFIFYIAAQFQAAGDAFASTFGMSTTTAIVVGAVIILFYTLLGGFWAVSVTDTVQGLLMALTAVVLPVTALIAAGGFSGLAAGLTLVSLPHELSATGVHAGIAGFGFIAGTLGIGLGYPGQPHVVNRFMALRDQAALRQARMIAVGWAIVVYAGMLLLGLCARVLTFEFAGSGEQVLYVAANTLMPPVLAGIMIAAVLSAIMSTADSQLLVAASSVAHDLGKLRRGVLPRLATSRWVVGGVCGLAVLLAIYAPDRIFSRVLFAWHAVGSAFGPLVLMKIMGRVVNSGAILACLVTGFGLTVLLHSRPDTPGDISERLLPLLLALLIAWFGSRYAREE